MADGNNVFNYVYSVSKDKGNYTVGSQITANVTVVDNFADTKGDKTDSGALLGDVSNDQFTYKGNIYTYVGSTGDGQFLASTGNGSSVSYLLFSDTRAESNASLSVKSASTAICFLPGTRIATPGGEIAVESLHSGDLVKTHEGHPIPVRWIGRQTISTRFADPLRVLPICIKADALSDNVPARDLYVSPCHALLVDGILIQAGALVNGGSIVRVPAPSEVFTYYHVETSDHSLVLAENVPAETFIDNVDRLAFDNWEEHEALGGVAPITEMSYPRAKAYRQVPVATRERLAARSLALFVGSGTEAA